MKRQNLKVKHDFSHEDVEVSRTSFASFKQVRLKVKNKIREDLFRFRTCCADPRASK